MQLKPEALAAHVDRNGLQALYTIHGDEPLLAQEAADALRAAARKAGFGERKVYTVAGAHFDWSAVQGAAQSMSLFADRQLIELRIPSGKPGKPGSAALQQYADLLGGGPAQDVMTIVQLPRLDRQQQASAWFSALDARGVSVRVEAVDRRALPQWLAQRLARQQQRVKAGEEGQRTLDFFADQVEGNLLAAHQELQKLALLHPEGELSPEAVERSVLNVARYDVFKLGEAVLGGQVARALRMLDGLRSEGEAAVLVHWTLAEDLRALKRVRDAVDQGRPLPLALREARVWGNKERLFERAVPQLASADLAGLVSAASICDGLVKGLRHAEWPADPWAALRRLMLMTMEALSRPRAGRPSPAARP